MVDVFDRHGVRFDPRLAGCSRFVRYSDYAALEAQLAERVKVKPLEWVELNEGKAFRALLPVIGSIRIEPYGVCGWWEVLWSMPGQCDKLIPDVFDTPDEAKAAAQADYERRILSTLEATPPAPEDSEPARVYEPYPGAFDGILGPDTPPAPKDPWPVHYANTTAPGRFAPPAPKVTEEMVEAGHAALGAIRQLYVSKDEIRAALTAAQEAGKP